MGFSERVLFLGIVLLIGIALAKCMALRSTGLPVIRRINPVTRTTYCAAPTPSYDTSNIKTQLKTAIVKSAINKCKEKLLSHEKEPITQRETTSPKRLSCNILSKAEYPISSSNFCKNPYQHTAFVPDSVTNSDIFERVNFPEVEYPVQLPSVVEQNWRPMFSRTNNIASCGPFTRISSENYVSGNRWTPENSAQFLAFCHKVGTQKPLTEKNGPVAEEIRKTSKASNETKQTPKDIVQNNIGTSNSREAVSNGKNPLPENDFNKSAASETIFNKTITAVSEVNVLSHLPGNDDKLQQNVPLDYFVPSSTTPPNNLTQLTPTYLSQTFTNSSTSSSAKSSSQSTTNSLDSVSSYESQSDEKPHITFNISNTYINHYFNLPKTTEKDGGLSSESGDLSSSVDNVEAYRDTSNFSPISPLQADTIIADQKAPIFDGFSSKKSPYSQLPLDERIIPIIEEESSLETLSNPINDPILPIFNNGPLPLGKEHYLPVPNNSLPNKTQKLPPLLLSADKQTKPSKYNLPTPRTVVPEALTKYTRDDAISNQNQQSLSNIPKSKLNHIVDASDNLDHAYSSSKANNIAENEVPTAETRSPVSGLPNLTNYMWIAVPTPESGTTNGFVPLILVQKSTTLSENNETANKAESMLHENSSDNIIEEITTSNQTISDVSDDIQPSEPQYIVIKNTKAKPSKSVDDTNSKIEPTEPITVTKVIETPKNSNNEPTFIYILPKTVEDEEEKDSVDNHKKTDSPSQINDNPQYIVIKNTKAKPSKSVDDANNITAPTEPITVTKVIETPQNSDNKPTFISILPKTVKDEEEEDSVDNHKKTDSPSKINDKPQYIVIKNTKAKPSKSVDDANNQIEPTEPMTVTQIIETPENSNIKPTFIYILPKTVKDEEEEDPVDNHKKTDSPAKINDKPTLVKIESNYTSTTASEPENVSFKEDTTTDVVPDIHINKNKSNASQNEFPDSQLPLENLNDGFTQDDENLDDQYKTIVIKIIRRPNNTTQIEHSSLDDDVTYKTDNLVIHIIDNQKNDMKETENPIE